MITEALERHAERGTVRGPEAVWEGALRGRGSERLPEPRGQRALVWAAAAVIAVVGFGVLRWVGPGPTGRQGPSATAPSGDADADADADDEGLPPPLFIAGMDLVRVNAPFDPDTCCVPDFLDRFAVRGEASSFSSGDPTPTRTQVFALADEPTSGPVLGVEHLPGGGFRPWAVNLGDTALESLTAGLERVGDDWRPDPSTGLTEVADVTDDPFDQLRFGWQVDFEGGGRQASIQSESAARSSVWLWLARSEVGSNGSDAAPTIEPVTIASNFDGLAVIRPTGQDGGAPTVELIWEADGWVNRLTLARIDGNTAYGADARTVAADVTLAARGDWRSAVEDTNGLFVGRSPIRLIVEFLLAAAWVLVAAQLVGRGRGTIGAVLIGFVAVWFFGTSAGDALVVLIGLSVGALVVAAGPRLGLRVPAPIRDLWAWGPVGGDR